MSHTPHELAEEFPDKVQQIRDLKLSDAHFARLYDEYHALNRQVRQAEANVNPMEALAKVQLRKQRASLKDELWGILSQA